MKSVALLALMTFQYVLPPANNEPIKSYAGHYMLVTRVWDNSGCSDRYGDAVSFNACWVYSQQVYDTLQDAQVALTTCENGWCRYKQENFVGIYKLTDALTRDKVKFSQGDIDVPETVKPHKEHWEKWDLH